MGIDITERVDIAVIGAGPAGLTAAIEATRAGAKVLLVDENATPGGQLFKQIHKFFGSSEHFAGMRGFAIGQQLLEKARELGVEISLNTICWGIFSGLTLGLVRCGTTPTCLARRIIVATGATENAIAFPGWTLPGVMGAGAAQTMINVQRVLPGKRVLMVGSGNVGLIVSYQLLQAGADVVMILEAMPQVGGYGVHAAKVRRAGIPIKVGHTILSAHGEERVERATIAKVDKYLKLIPETEEQVEVDTICLAVGLTPMVELLSILGIKFGYSPVLGGHVPLHDENMETSVAGLYVAGDVSGVEEASTAMEVGRLAGVAAAESLGYLTASEAKSRKEKIRFRLAALRSSPFGEHRRQKGTDQLGNGFVGRGGLARTGVPSIDEIAQCPGSPSWERMQKGPVAVVECFEEIPCNPCEKLCPRRAIHVGQPITRLPVIDPNRCTGCGRCIPGCPGLAIFVVDLSGEKAIVSFPYEYLPIPQQTDMVPAVNREGKVVTKGEVVAVRSAKGYDATVVVSVAVPRELAMEVRGIKI